MHSLFKYYRGLVNLDLSLSSCRKIIKYAICKNKSIMYLISIHIYSHFTMHYIAISIVTDHYSNASPKMLVALLQSVFRINPK